jgi:hypothetical protein
MNLLFRGLLAAALLASTACAALYPFDYYVLRDGPISIGDEWTEFNCPDVIKTTRPDKELWLLMPKPLDVPDYRDEVAVYRKTGERIEILAEIVDADGKVYPMPNWTQRGIIAGRPREGTYIRLLGDDLPRTFRLTTVRLRSSRPINLAEVLWIDSRGPAPPNSSIRSL